MAYLLIATNFFLLSVPCIIVYSIVAFLSILQSDAIFVLSGTKNDIAGQKTISRDKKRYRGTYRFYVTVLSP